MTSESCVPGDHPYNVTQDSLKGRILALIPAHPSIMTMTNPFDLFPLGLKVNDLQPSFSQASSALKEAQAEYQSAQKRPARLDRGMEDNRPEDLRTDLTGKEMADEGKKLGKDIITTSIVWTLAGVMTKALRSLIRSLSGGKF